MQLLDILIAGSRFAEHDLGLGAEGGKRRAQLVGDIVWEARQRFKVMRELNHHCIIGFCKRSQFTGHIRYHNSIVELVGIDTAHFLPNGRKRCKA